MYRTEIHANGSKMFGGRPDDLDALLRILAQHLLDRTFERTFIQKLGDGAFRFQGNFRTVSHVFDIRSNDPEVTKRLIAAILANRRMPGFRDQPSAARQMRAIREWIARPKERMP